MNHLNVNSDASFLQLPESLTTSPSQSTFMAEEDASICPLLHNTSSPQLFSHPLTPSPGIASDIGAYIYFYYDAMTSHWRHDCSVYCTADDQVENDDTSESSSGIGMGITNAIGMGTNYHHLHKNGDMHHQVSYLKALKVKSINKWNVL